MKYTSEAMLSSFIQILSEISEVSFPISISICQAAVTKVMSTCPRLNLVHTQYLFNLSGSIDKSVPKITMPP